MKIKRAPVVTATLIPRNLEVQPSELNQMTAAALMNRLRSQLVRAEQGAADLGLLREQRRGWLIAGLHCEFDPTAPLYQWHYHALASGHMITVLNCLREQRIYKRARGDRVRDRVRMSRKPLDNLPAPLGYPWQSFWPERARGNGMDEDVGFNQLHRRKRRLREPYHTQMLLWLDQQQITNMTLLVGLCVGHTGLVRTYVKGERL